MTDIKRLSQWLYNILECNGISDEEREEFKIAGKREEILETLISSVYYSIYIFGSKIEGTFLPEYDVDGLRCFEFVPAYEFLTDLNSTEFEVLMLPSSYSHQGFVKLRLYHNGLPAHRNDLSKITLDHEYLTSDCNGNLFWKIGPKLFRRSNPGAKRKGPADNQITQANVNCDLVYALRCKSWPSVAKEWITRNRSWPSKNTVNKLIKFGCFLVPVGNVNSPEKDLEHRISFSLQERELMFGLNGTQFRCYVMLKVIKKELLQPKLGSVLSSYHCKTALFYTIERTDSSLWQPCNLFQCVMMCLKLLLEWVEDMNCPNYFIPGENMFSGKISRSNSEVMSKAIKNVLNEGIQFLRNINTYQINYHFMNKTTISEDDWRARRRIEHHKELLKLELIKHSVFYRNKKIIFCAENNFRNRDLNDSENVYKYIQFMRCEIKRLIQIKSISEHTVDETQYVVNCIVPYLRCSLGGHYANLINKKNDNVTNAILYRSAKEQFEYGLNCDLTSGKLRYATFLFTLGKYEECNKLLEELSGLIEGEHITTCPCRSYKSSMNRQRCLIATLSCDRLTDMKMFVCICTTFLPPEFVFVPFPLRFEYYRGYGLKEETPDREDWYDWVVIDSIPYFYFLKYLMAVEQDRPKREIMDIIQGAVGSLINENLQHRETALNIISVMYAYEYDIPKAFYYLFESMKIQVDTFDEEQVIWYQTPLLHNAAKWHILVNLFELWYGKCRVNFCFECLEIKEGNLLKCRHCQVSRYCSDQCMRAYWPKHKTFCRLFCSP